MEMKSIIKEVFEELFGLKEGDYFNIVGSGYAYNPYLVEKNCISDCDFDYIEDEAIEYALKNPSSVELIDYTLVKITVNNMVYSIRPSDLRYILDIIEEKCVECENEPSETDITDTASSEDAVHKNEKAMIVSDIKMSAEKFKRYHYFLKNKDKALYVLRGVMGGYGEGNYILDIDFFTDMDEALSAAEELARESYKHSGQMDTFIEQYQLEECGSYPDQYEIDEDMLSWITYRAEKLTEESLKNIIENEGRTDYEWYLDYFKWFETCHK